MLIDNCEYEYAYNEALCILLDDEAEIIQWNDKDSMVYYKVYHPGNRAVITLKELNHMYWKCHNKIIREKLFNFIEMVYND